LPVNRFRGCAFEFVSAVALLGYRFVASRKQFDPLDALMLQARYETPGNHRQMTWTVLHRSYINHRMKSRYRAQPARAEMCSTQCSTQYVRDNSLWWRVDPRLYGMSMRPLMVLVFGATVLAALLGVAKAACGEDCDTEYQSDVDHCHSIYGDDPADAADLARCIDNARDDYRNCVENCADQAD
jgi:hypothetical protein